MRWSRVRAPPGSPLLYLYFQYLTASTIDLYTILYKGQVMNSPKLRFAPLLDHHRSAAHLHLWLLPTILNAETLGTFASEGEDLLSADLIEA